MKNNVFLNKMADDLNVRLRSRSDNSTSSRAIELRDEARRLVDLSEKVIDYGNRFTETTRLDDEDFLISVNNSRGLLSDPVYQRISQFANRSMRDGNYTQAEWTIFEDWKNNFKHRLVTEDQYNFLAEAKPQEIIDRADEMLYSK